MQAPHETISIDEATSKGEIIAFPSGAAVMGDPCYLDRLRRQMKPDMLANFLAGPADAFEMEDCLIFKVVNTMPIHVDHEDGVVSAWEIGDKDLRYRERNDYMTADLGVDSGQMAVLDLGTFIKSWVERDYEDIRIYEHKKTGKRLQYMLDFPHYEAPIASEGGKNMNQLNASGEWEVLEFQGTIDWSYTGLCHCHDNSSDAAVLGGRAFVTGSGFGDGAYPARIWFEGSKAVQIGIVFVGSDDEEEEEDYFDDEEEADEEEADEED